MSEIEPAGRSGRQRLRGDAPRRRPAGELDPEFIMLGVDVPAGKRIYASKELTRSQFSVVVNTMTGAADGWHLSSDLAHMLIVTKPTYGEAMAEVLKIWNNWLRGKNELESREHQPERGIAMEHGGPMKMISPS